MDVAAFIFEVASICCSLIRKKDCYPLFGSERPGRWNRQYELILGRLRSREIVSRLLIGCDECWFGWAESNNAPTSLDYARSSISVCSAKWLGSLLVLSIEMAIDLFQWIFFAAMPSRTLNPLSVVTVGSKSVICHSVVSVWLGCEFPCCSSLGYKRSIYFFVLFTFTIFR